MSPDTEIVPQLLREGNARWGACMSGELIIRQVLRRGSILFIAAPCF